MPQGKRGQRSAGVKGKGSSRTAAKAVPAKPVKRKVAEVVAKPVVKRKAAKAVVKPAVKRKVAAVVTKPAAKRKVAEVVAKPVKKRRKADSPETAEVEQTVEVPVVEPVVEYWVAESGLEPVGEPWTGEPQVEPTIEDWVANSRIEDIVELAVEPVETQEAAEATTEMENENADSLFKPFIERRVTIRSFLERRLMDPSAKERRVSDSLARECAAEAATNQPRIAAAARERKTKIAADAKELKAANAAAGDGNTADPAVYPFAERRVADRRAGAGIEAELRVREQQNLFNETALWLRKGGTALIGLNVLIVLAVLVLWRTHSSQAPDMTEMQKATMAEMRRATAASEVAAYASCLGSQTAQSILMQMKAGSLGGRIAPSGNGAPAIAATREQAAQIEFDVEKTTNVNVHIPVLFHLGVENIGKSSALNTKVWGAVKVLDSGKEPNFKYSEVALSKAAISPSDPTAKVVLYSADDSGLVVPLNEATMQRVNSGEAYVVAYGKVVYEDIFGARHWAVFCHNITEPAGTGRHSNKCMAYNSTGVSDVPGRPVETSVAPQSAAMKLPEIACQLPKQEKN
jgi:hypothetical protein